jgi:hypothetical protein
MRSRSLLIAGACALCAWLGCAEREPADVEPVPVAQTSAKPEAPTAVPADPIKPAAPPPDATPWDPIKLDDEAPLCVFSGHDTRDEAMFLKDVRKQTLRAGSSVVFGTFAPGCIHEACDTGPLMQCFVDADPDGSLVVHSHLAYEHKRGSTCSEGCRPIIAGCESAPLAAGKYTVKYGSRSFTLRIPAVMRSPCFKLD